MVHTASRNQFSNPYPQRGSSYVQTFFASFPSLGFLWAQDPAVPRETRGKHWPITTPTHSVTLRKYSLETLDEPGLSLSLVLAQLAQPALRGPVPLALQARGTSLVHTTSWWTKHHPDDVKCNKANREGNSASVHRVHMFSLQIACVRPAQICIQLCLCARETQVLARIRPLKYGPRH